MISKSPRRPMSAARNANGQMPPPSLLSTPEQVISYYRRLGLPLDPMVDIERIVQSNPELDLVYEDLGVNDAYIKKVSEEKYVIAINSRHHPNRQKFSIAHEYAHYLLHRDKIHNMPKGEQILHRNASRNSIEYQANAFAAELLMPGFLVNQAFVQSNGRLKKMADILNVSQEALRYRLEALGYSVA